MSRYDSVTVDGKLDWQDCLNTQNKPFFDVCDGIFTNYTWKHSYPSQSAELAADRHFHVYTGIDIWGRNTFGGGGFHSYKALEVIKEAKTSVALFAPGKKFPFHDFLPNDFFEKYLAWTYENNKDAFLENDTRFWVEPIAEQGCVAGNAAAANIQILYPTRYSQV